MVDFPYGDFVKCYKILGIWKNAISPRIDLNYRQEVKNIDEILFFLLYRLF